MKVKALIAGLALSLAAHAAEQTLTLKINGWHSKGDAFKTEQAVREVKGVTGASANMAGKQLTVTYDDAVASPAAIAKAVSDAGYSSHP